ncbi:GAF and ANTAR domain-containing protein [Streptomyces vinaceus]
MTRERLMTEAFVEAADSLTDDFDLIEFLQRLSVRCADLLRVAAAGILLADQDEGLQTIAASDEHTRLLELFALQHGQGPCLDCYTSGQARTAIDLTDPVVIRPWAPFAALAVQTGFTAMDVFPLRLRGHVIGTLAIFQERPAHLTGADLTLAQALADVATIAILQQRTADHGQIERAQLQHALTSRIILEQAKGVLAERWHTSVDDAFFALRSYARAHNRQLTKLAGEVIDGTLDTTAIPRPGTEPPKH